jgi:hypothetical protein
MINREQLTADLAKIHGIRIDADDPVLVSALLNQRLLDDAIGRLEAAVRASADRITAAATQQVDGAKDAAASLVMQAGEWSAERLRIAADEVGSLLLSEVRQEVNRAERASRSTVRVAWLIITAATVTLAGVIGFIAAGLGYG